VGLIALPLRAASQRRPRHSRLLSSTSLQMPDNQRPMPVHALDAAQRQGDCVIPTETWRVFCGGFVKIQVVSVYA
jgi:hypothetical protein